MRTPPACGRCFIQDGIAAPGVRRQLILKMSTLTLGDDFTQTSRALSIRRRAAIHLEPEGEVAGAN